MGWKKLSLSKKLSIILFIIPFALLIILYFYTILFNSNYEFSTLAFSGGSSFADAPIISSIWFFMMYGIYALFFSIPLALIGYFIGWIINKNKP